MAENREDARCNPPDAIPIRDHFRPVINAPLFWHCSGDINANNFELKPALINMVQQNQFAGTATADPHVHLRTFLEITDTRPSKRMALIASTGEHHNVARLKIEISTFRQTDFEQLYEAWERYKELLRRCPNHGFEDWVQIELFYNGLNGETRTTVDAATCGTIFAKSPAQAYNLLEQMTINSYQWPSERSGVKRTARVYVVDPITSLTAQVSTLTTQIATMNKVSTSNTEGPSVVEESEFPEEVQYINNKNFGGYGGYRGNPPPNTYHPGLRNHENFSYANNKNVLNPPPGFNTSNGEGKPSFEDLVRTFVAESSKRMARTESTLDNLETHMANIGASSKILELQVRQITKQLTSQPSGTVQKTADPNLREVNAVFIQHMEIGVVSREEKKVELTPIQDEKPTPTKRVRAEFHKKKGLEDLKNLHTNIESADQKEVEFPEGTRRNLPHKLQNPGELAVPCEIRGKLVEKAICDSEASVNIMPSSLYEKLGLSRMEPTGLSLQMANKLVRTPLGIVEDVELRIDKLKVQAEFVILDMENSQNVHVISERPSLTTVGAIIDVKRGKLTMEVEGQMVEIKTSKKSYDPP
ncbi:uncharacterized protein [Primulina huaijiensis]|uniref:uncharacterized protein n=1 Tax=Primulina huaijiensis TaxID=1492673 RepID=UPI003CC71EE9